MNPTIELLKSHRSIRKFTDQPVSRELLEELIRAGQGAATSSHVQAYTVIHVTRPENREKIAELAGGQGYVASCGAFLMFCADMKRPTEAAERTGARVVRGMTEQLLVATVDTALMAQNVAVAAESAGLGICYIGGVRNNPQAISDLLGLPDHVYPVFGMCLGYPAHEPDVKPRLLVEAVLKEDTYSDDRELVAAFDDTMHAYYQSRKGGNKQSTWSQNLTPLFDTKLRPHMREFLVKRGFEMK
ncbi:oxygen-insensitive NADPH nitroreductase [Halomonas mongoliensis]|uniref:Oxygen-insensitive NADPH nitroreductase n=1 Tax=Halomonas mongoliensis TaxID=321265 RepID=A0ABU1GJ63_9GAMM|nr:oxygen-insensitive NADPH nitroreductase [Halomonas mongoliensis]MDR5892013.1 oxygen-insensitive NADPH nitroreductase [Halomonas mongoliensis]